MIAAKHNRFRWVGFMMICYVLTACDPPAKTIPPLTHQKMWLTNHPWLVCCQSVQPAIAFRNQEIAQMDLRVKRPPCDRDDVMIFLPNGHWRLTEGESTCGNSSDTLITHGNWDLVGTTDSLTLELINREGDPYRYSVLFLDSTTLVRRYETSQYRQTFTITEVLTVVR